MNNIYLNILAASFETINQISHILIFVLVFFVQINIIISICI